MGVLGELAAELTERIVGRNLPRQSERCLLTFSQHNSIVVLNDSGL